MSASASNHLTPTKLRVILVVVFVFLIALGSVIFLLGYKQIKQYSQESQSKSTEALESNSKVTTLMSIKQKLEANASVVDQASQLVAESQYYAYQDQIIKDINTYAARAGVGINGITFNDSAISSSGTTNSSSSSGSTAAPVGIKTTTATVTFSGDVNYTSYLKFLHSLEQGLFRMSVLGISIARSSGNSGSDNVTSQPLNIEVYIR
jgi:hypothetical protein